MDIVGILGKRFVRNPFRHAGILWEMVEARLKSNPEAVRSLEWMEESGGEPDAIGMDGDHILFADCSKESPRGRRSLCYDEAALRGRRRNPPAGSAEGQSAKNGIALMTEKQYRLLQSFGEFDLKTSSWIATPKSIRDLGGALFCERRYGAVFVFHNGADSYYGVRGWRGALSV